MEILFIICAILTIVSSEKLSPDEEDKVFAKFLADFHINVESSNIAARREIFLKNYYEVQEHNERFRNGSVSFEKAINKFSHLSCKELFKTYNGYVPVPSNATISPLRPKRLARMATPSSWSWRDFPGALGPTTSQGPCGSCTVFAVIGTMEAHMRIWYGINTKLSEQEAMQCCGGCGGGTNSYIYDYAKNGAAYDKDYKYVAKVLEKCNTNRPRVPGSKVLSYYRIERGADAVKNAMWHLVNVGPLATGLCVPGSFGSYKSGVYDDENMNDCGWHAVMVVGFGNENGKDYWLARNSYGSGFGDEGYFKILRGKNLCRLEDDFTFPNMGY